MKPPYSYIVPPVIGIVVIAGVAFAYSANRSVTPLGPAADVVPVEAPAVIPEEQGTPAAVVSVPTPTNTTVPTSKPVVETPAPVVASYTYKNGTYTASGSYRTPESTETMQVTLTVAKDVVTDVSVSMNVRNGDSRSYVESFLGGYKAQVVGKKLNTLNLSRVSGSSLTPLGFNKALESIRAEAQA